MLGNLTSFLRRSDPSLLSLRPIAAPHIVFFSRVRGRKFCDPKIDAFIHEYIYLYLTHISHVNTERVEYSYCTHEY